ncbi:esterase [Rugosibacter aromaticivorans]|uniref:Esterase n=1 Tax=Rugosibacter aromaticivorans TaxID=1565605 RepID=A0A0C5JPA2_9PROT|nr:YqiA/YcfP family alpha/beta fold hydrolase [Rugosibacter aromaticivorans]AJP49111.1 esterase [Rugosibacter aromaticivorans]
MILYLHGFTSGPQSVKARALGERMAARGLAADFVCPQLPASPAAALALAEQIIMRQKVGDGETATHGKIMLVGSSLGGFYATWLAEKFNLNAVLVNPAVVARLSLESFVGPQRWLYTGEPFDFTLQHIDELRALELPRLSQPQRFWLLAEEGDETLDYRAAVAYYAGARQTVLPGGDHSFTRWNDYLDEIIDWRPQ